MIPSIVGAGIIGKFLYDINESHSMEEEAEEKRLEAIAREAEGWLLQKQKADRMQRRLNNIVRKRQAIMEYTLPRFVKVYGKIQTVLYESLPAFRHPYDGSGAHRGPAGFGNRVV